MLLGLIKDPGGDATQLLDELGVPADAIRQAVMKRLGSAAGGQPAEP